MKSLSALLLIASISFADTERVIDYSFSGGCAREEGRFLSAEGGCKDTDLGLVWGPVSSSKTFAEATAYCDHFQNGVWKEWRLPRLKDIQALVASEAGKRGVLKAKNLLDFFWVRDYASEDTQHVALLVSDDSTDRLASEKASVICVRQGLEKKLGCQQGETDYFITAEGGCLYKKTRRAFSQPAPTTKSLGAAVKYCDDLVEGTKSDWRLPELAELHAIAWPGGADAHFKFTTAGDFWSKTETSSYSTNPTQAGGGTILIGTSQSFINWINLKNGQRGQAIYASSTTPFGADGSSISRQGFFGSYFSSQRYDISERHASVVCVRPDYK